MVHARCEKSTIANPLNILKRRTVRFWRLLMFSILGWEPANSCNILTKTENKLLWQPTLRLIQTQSQWCTTLCFSVRASSNNSCSNSIHSFSFKFGMANSPFTIWSSDFELFSAPASWERVRNRSTSFCNNWMIPVNLFTSSFSLSFHSRETRSLKWTISWAAILSSCSTTLEIWIE